MSDEPAVTDPARARTEIVPLRTTDIRLQTAIQRLILGTWDSAQAAAEWGVSKAAAATVASWAGSFLRVQRTPELLVETALSELRQIAEQARDQAPAVSVAAWKTILDQIGKLVDREQKRASAADDATLEDLLLAPPPDLLALLLRAWLTPALASGVPDVVAVLEAHGWRATGEGGG